MSFGGKGHFKIFLRGRTGSLARGVREVLPERAGISTERDCLDWRCARGRMFLKPFSFFSFVFFAVQYFFELLNFLSLFESGVILFCCSFKVRKSILRLGHCS